MTVASEQAHQHLHPGLAGSQITLACLAWTTMVLPSLGEVNCHITLSSILAEAQPEWHVSDNVFKCQQ